jgi:predicted enzyme related to lactoylglutathione lyase
MTQSNPVVWFEIYVNDMTRARAFYEAVLGVKLEKLPDPGPGVAEMVTFPMTKDATGATGALARMEKGGPPNGNGVIVYFSCEDCATESKRALASGGKVMKDKFSIGQYGFISLVNDTEGNVIGLHSMKWSETEFRPTLAKVDRWIKEQEDRPSRPEAIRRMVEQALGARAPQKRNKKAATKARKMADRELDRVADPALPVEVQERRK